MTYNEFRDKYKGKYIDVDNQYGAQCWDLAQRYFTECLKLPASVLGGCGLVSNMLYPPKRNELDKYFDEVPTTAMYGGDVVIWEYGHIAIFDHWDGKKNWYFSQNPNPCNVITINRYGVHAFRLKGEKPTTIYKTVSNCYWLNLRTSPSYGNNIYTSIKVGTKLEYLGEESGWAKVKYDNKTLYCGKNYLK